MARSSSAVVSGSSSRGPASSISSTSTVAFLGTRVLVARLVERCLVLLGGPVGDLIGVGQRELLVDLGRLRFVSFDAVFVLVKLVAHRRSPPCRSSGGSQPSLTVLAGAAGLGALHRARADPEQQNEFSVGVRVR